MENLQIPGGVIDDEYKEYSVKTYGEYTSVDQIANTVVGNKNGTPIYLKQVARVVDGYKDMTEIIRNNGQDAMILVVMKQSDANTVQVARDIQKELPNIVARIEPSLEFRTIINQAEFIENSINNLTTTAYQAFILAFFVLFFFLRHFRSSFIAAISIPVSIIVTFFVMNQAGLTLNIISMAGLALAIGMLIDNCDLFTDSVCPRDRRGDVQGYGDHNRIFADSSEKIGDWIENIENRYVKILDYFLGQKKLFLSGIVVLLIATLFIFRYVGGEFISRTDQPSIQIIVERESRDLQSVTRDIQKTLENINFPDSAAGADGRCLDALYHRNNHECDGFNRYDSARWYCGKQRNCTRGLHQPAA